MNIILIILFSRIDDYVKSSEIVLCRTKRPRTFKPPDYFCFRMADMCAGEIWTFFETISDENL